MNAHQLVVYRTTQTDGQTYERNNEPANKRAIIIVFNIKTFDFPFLSALLYTNAYLSIVGDVNNFKDAFADSDYSPGSLAIGFYSGFWAFGGW